MDWGPAEAAGEKKREKALPARMAETVRKWSTADEDRFFLWVPVLVCVGLAVYYRLSWEPGIWQVLAFLGIAVAAAAAVLRSSVKASLVILLVAAGFVLGKARSELLQTPTLRADTGVVTVAGWVEHAEIRSDKQQRIVLAVEQSNPALPSERGLRVRITLSRSVGDFSPGDAAVLKARLFKPRRPIAPDAFDFARRDWFRGIGGSGYAFSVLEPPDDLGVPSWSLRARSALAGLRRRIADAAHDFVEDKRAAFLVAVLTGERGRLDETAVDQLRASGLAHLLAISGLHMGLVAYTLFTVLRAVLALSARAALRWPIKKWAAVGALLGGGGYLALSGAAVSTQRAYIMVAIMFLAVLLDRPAISMRNVAFAALVILALRPESVLDVSFQMSFLAVVGLVALYEFREGSEWPGSHGAVRHNTGVRLARTLGFYFAGILLTTIIAGLATGPIAAYHFNRVATYGVIGNLAAIPLMGSVVMPFALIGTALLPLGLAAPFYQASGMGIEAILLVAEWASSIPGAVRAVPAMPVEALAAMLLGMLWICLWRARWRWFGCAAIFIGIATAAASERPDILVSDDAAWFVARNAEGELVAPAGTRGGFALERWLAADGDTASPREASTRDGMTCDREACVLAGWEGKSVAFLKDASALWHECQRAAIVITGFSYRGKCPSADLVIDSYALYKFGAHAVYLRRGETRVRRVADERGTRPWTEPEAVRNTKTSEATDSESADAPAEQNPLPNRRAVERTDKAADALERVAFRIHDFGDWLLRFIR